MDNLKLHKPYQFEGKEYTEIDLSGLDNLTTAALVRIERNFDRGGNFSALKEMNLEYCLLIACEVTGLPIEFFNGLPAKDCTQLKLKVSGYFFGEV